ncbi:hypothetical protein ACROYT_G040504 [Oculina patagonica]
MASPWPRQSFKAKVTPKSRDSSPFTPRQSLNFSLALGDSGTTARIQQRALLTSHLLEETDKHCVETFGLPLPVQISENLTNQEAKQHTSVKINHSGWAWLVTGRKLFVWRFISAVGTKTVQIPDDYKLVSFDVKSLFTSIPLQLALQCTETAIQQSTVTLPLPTEDIMDLLNLCLTSTYFQYNGKHYKQLHGTAMGSPVSVVVAEIVMQNIEERALATCRQTIPLWLRYVDDTFTAVHKDEIDDFHKHLNEQNADIQFTREIEENGKLPFLDCLVSRDNNKIRTTVYRKPTHTDRLLDETSYNPTSHKATTIKTLTRRAQLVCDTPDSLSDENKYLDRVFHKNNYNTDFIRRNTHRTTETDRNLTSVTTATLPYIKGTSETIARILQPYNIRVAHKPITTLRHLLTNVKDRDEPNNRQGAIYKIKCSDCQASYIGETGRNLTTRLTEHKRATRNGDVNNHISEHHRLTKHKIDWDSAECLTYSTNYFQRLTLESWYTNLEQTPINRCQQLPAPYKRLIHDVKRSDKRTANRTT